MILGMLRFFFRSSRQLEKFSRHLECMLDSLEKFLWTSPVPNPFSGSRPPRWYLHLNARVNPRCESLSLCGV